MAIVLKNVASGQQMNVGANVNVAFDCGAGADYLRVSVFSFKAEGTGVHLFYLEYNAVLMNDVPSAIIYDATGQRCLQQLYLPGPASGSHNVTFTPTTSNLDTMWGFDAWSGVDPAAPAAAVTGLTNTATVTTAAGDLAVGSVGVISTVNSDAGPLDITLWDQPPNANGSVIGGQYQTGTGAITVNWSLGDLVSAMVLKAAAGGAVFGRPYYDMLVRRGSHV